MSVERVVFGHVVEGIHRAWGKTLSRPARAQLAQIGIDLGKKPAATYPFDAFVRALEILRRDLVPSLPVDDGMFALGQQYIDGYFETLLGSAVAGIVKLLGPRRTLLRATQQFRSANNFSEISVINHAPTDAELDMSSVDHPRFTRGMVFRGLVIAGARELSVDILPPLQPGGCHLRVRWRA